MEFLRSKKFCDADRPSRLIPKFREPLEDTMTDRQVEVTSPTKNKSSSLRKRKNKKKTLPEPESEIDEPMVSPTTHQILPEEMDHTPSVSNKRRHHSIGRDVKKIFF